ncbi:MAG: hypothetical protein HOH04_00030 [Rhodospirillaceae bacterium]|jgi:hypothetical protein|nr:hypothetical protein [Rhodospirillaceae bacterium]
MLSDFRNVALNNKREQRAEPSQHEIGQQETGQQEIGTMKNTTMAQNLSKCMGLAIGTAFGMAITAYGASAIVASGLRVVIP